MDALVSMIDQINRLFLGWLRRPEPAVSIAGDTLVLGDRPLPLRELLGVVAHEVDVYAGAVIALTLSFPGGVTVTTTQEDACWDDLLAALDRLGLTTRPSREWLVELIASERRRPAILLRGRPGTGA
jgi:hypothetical protein